MLFVEEIGAFSVQPSLRTTKSSSLASSSASDLASPPPTPVENVLVLEDADGVGELGAAALSFFHINKYYRY